MKSSTDPEKQHLIDTHLETLVWVSSPEKKCSDSEFGEDALSVEGLLQHEWLCQEDDWRSVTERDSRCLARKKLFTACAVSLVFMTGEAIGGYAAGSLAIMTDAAHLLTDFVSIVISIFSLWIASRPKTGTMTFGWYRAEILAMFLSVVSIWAVTVVLVLSAVQRISDGEYEIDSEIMLITSGCAVGVNVLMILILHQPGSSHGHSHGFATNLTQRDKHGQRNSHGNASVKAAFVHVVGDLVQSVGVMLAATIIHFWPEYKVADPICTFLFSLLVIGTTLPVTRDVFRILLEGAPRDVSFGAVRELLLSVGGVTAIHSLNMWSLNTTHSLLSVHLATEEDADSQIILRKATRVLRSKFGFTSITIQVESCRISGSKCGGLKLTEQRLVTAKIKALGAPI